MRARTLLPRGSGSRRTTTVWPLSGRAGYLRIGWALVATCALAAGCEGGGAPGAWNAGSGSASGADPSGSEGNLHAADLARGEILSFACRACHGLTPDAPSPLGPPLHGMFGRPAASLDGFDYSPALQQSGIVWTEDALDAWLARPDEFLPGNYMAFTGFQSADDRRALIAYLKMETAQ